jgi:hypothetical protein
MYDRAIAATEGRNPALIALLFSAITLILALIAPGVHEASRRSPTGG